MTDNEIIKAFEYCVNNEECKYCPMLDDCPTNHGLQKQALDLINRLKADNERLKNEDWKSLSAIIETQRNEIVKLDRQLKTAKSEAYKEFVTKAEEKATNLKDCTGTEVVFTVDDLYDLLKEMGCKTDD